MESTDFIFSTFGNNRIKDCPITLEELYQHFAERFRRENEVVKGYVVENADGGACWVDHAGDIVEKERPGD